MVRVSLWTNSIHPTSLLHTRWILELESRHVSVDGGLSQVLEWDTKRGRNFQNIAFMVCCCDGLPDNEHIPTAQKVEKWLCRVDRPTEQFKLEIEGVLKEFWNIAANPDLDAGFKKIGRRIAPVEFIFVGTSFSAQRSLTPIHKGSRRCIIRHAQTTHRTEGRCYTQTTQVHPRRVQRHPQQQRRRQINVELRQHSRYKHFYSAIQRRRGNVKREEET